MAGFDEEEEVEEEKEVVEVGKAEDAVFGPDPLFRPVVYGSKM